MKTWAIYNAPTGSPAPIVVFEWTGEPGSKPRKEKPVFAATLELARGVVPRTGLIRRDRSETEQEDPTLIEYWEPAS